MLQNTLNRFARIISTIFVPPSFTILIFTYFALHLETDLQKSIVTVLVALIFGFVAPIILFFILRKRGKIIDQDASVKEERAFPFKVAILFYFIGLIILIAFSVSTISIAFWFCYISNTFITIIINKLWKISAHSMGAAGPFAALIFTVGMNGILFIFIPLLVGWSRIKLKCHNFSQVAAGLILAFFSTYLQMYLIVRIFS